MAAVTSTTAIRDKIIKLAKSQLGVHEIPAYSNKTPYTQWYGITGPWCAMFVSWVFYHAGLPLKISTSKGFAYVPYGVDWFKKNGAWAGPATRPKPGWVVFFDFPNDGIGRPSHTGIVEGVAADGRIITLEGNTNAAGSRTGGNVMRHYRSRAGGIIGYGIINYKAPVVKPSTTTMGRVLELRSPMMTGADVKAVQTILVNSGVLPRLTNGKPTADGVFGRQTQGGVQVWQRRLNIPVTGKWDAITQRKTSDLLKWIAAQK